MCAITVLWSETLGSDEREERACRVLVTLCRGESREGVLVISRGGADVTLRFGFTCGLNYQFHPRIILEMFDLVHKFL